MFPVPYLIVGLLLFALVFYVITALPMDPLIKRIIQIIAVVLLALWLVDIFFGASIAWRLR